MVSSPRFLGRFACLLAVGLTCAAEAGQLSLAKSAVAPGEAIRASFSEGPGHPEDWIGIYPEGVQPGSRPSLLWAYTSGTHTKGNRAAKGTVTFAKPILPAGDYKVWFLGAGKYGPLAEAVPLTIARPRLPEAEGPVDWPTYRGDSQRSGQHPRSLPRGLTLHWSYRFLHPPAEAWPGTAQSDHWRKRSTPEPPRIVFDKAFEPVSAEGRVFLGSSADDQLRCLDLKTGELLWTTFADAPIRLAPTVVGERVLFGSDDGHLYGVEAATGRRLFRTSAAEEPGLLLPGNGRLISQLPVRTGVLVHGETGYFGAGIFPKQCGAWHCSLDPRTGAILDRAALDASPQGYLEAREGRIFAPTGRDPKGRFLAQLTAAAASPIAGKRASAAYPFAFLTTPTQGIGGGAGKVGILDDRTGALLQELEVEGDARALAIARDRLLVSTTEGVLYCFGARTEAPSETLRHDPGSVGSPHEPSVALRKAAASMLDRLPRPRGYALVLEADRDQGDLLLALAAGSDLQIVGLVAPEGSSLDRLRERVATAGYYGRVSVLEGDLAAPPFVPGIFNLLTSPRIFVEKDSPLALPEGLLRPSDGLAFLGNAEKPSHTGPMLEGIGEWTHMYADPANTACSGDSRIGGDLRLQWFGRPGPQHIIDRHLRPSPPLVKDGLLFVPGQNYLLAVDGWNGTILWEREIADFRRIGALRDSGNMAATSDTLYCVSGARCLGLSTATGEESRVHSLPEPVREDAEWGYLATVGSGLIGSSVKAGTVLRTMNYAAIYEGGYGDHTKVACSDALFALDRRSGETLWIYEAAGSIPNPSITVLADTVVFLESGDPETLETRPARMHYPQLIDASGASLVALDLKTGQERWRTQLDPRPGTQTLFTLGAKGHLALVNSRNLSATEGAAPTVHYEVRVFGMGEGQLLWEDRTNQGGRPNLDHGEQDRHPAIVGDRLVVEPQLYELASGKKLGTFKRVGGWGCGTISASANALYFRSGTAATYDFAKGESATITSSTRPGCWINMIPAGGLLLVPEGSSGCTCNFAVQSSLGFAPR